MLVKLSALVVATLVVVALGHPRLLDGGDNVGIYHGEESTEEVLFVASVWYYDIMICGGALFNQNFVITSAQCYISDVGERYKVKIGERLKLTSETKSQKVKRFIKHEMFDENTLDYDIALIELVNGNSNHVIPIPTTTVSDQTASIYGWGVNEYSEYPRTLQKTEIVEIKREDCQNVFKLWKRNITERMFCGGSIFKYASFGDIGSPVVWQPLDSAPLLLGIVSSISDYEALPNIFTNLTYFQDWIAKKILERDV